MRYSKEITINLPREKVINLFDNSDNMFKWMPGLKTFEHLSGEAGTAGAKSKLVFDMNGRVIEMVETISERNLPETFSATYEAKGVYNEVNNKFIEVNANATKWVIDTEFKFSGMMKIMGVAMKGAFPKQTLKNMNQFKDFAEDYKEN